jgi:hypothetical protein
VSAGGWASDSLTAPPVTSVRTGPSCSLPLIKTIGLSEAAKTSGVSVVRLKLALLLEHAWRLAVGPLVAGVFVAGLAFLFADGLASFAVELALFAAGLALLFAVVAPPLDVALAEHWGSAVPKAVPTSQLPELVTEILLVFSAVWTT